MASSTQWVEQYGYESDSDLGYLSDDGDLESSTISSQARFSGESLKNSFSWLTDCQMFQVFQSSRARPENKLVWISRGLDNKRQTLVSLYPRNPPAAMVNTLERLSV
jgi:hypothetical protein